jgi:GWxTD domain-containing protein
MKKILLMLFIIFLIAGGDFLVGKGKKDNPLPGKYRKWLDLVTYIITREERGTFLKLTNDRDRDVFISLFWNLRDPTPGTEKNEFKEEHLRRFQYANKYFKYGSPREGWKTDMGRIYIILGAPSGIDRYEMDNVVVPAQIWSFYGKSRPGLPANFWVVFWKKDSMGEYKIYEPASDGPRSLLRQTRDTAKLDPMDIEANYQAILDEHPALARASLTLIPDEIARDFRPSLRSQQLLGKVMELPRKQINDAYATDFLKYKGKVSVDYSINYIDARHKVLVIKDVGTGLHFVHFAIRPQKVSAQSLAFGKDNEYFFNFNLVVSLYKGDQPIFEYRKKFPFSGTRDEILRKFSNSLIISDFFPAAAGDYRLAALLQNRVNKEFTYIDTKISIPPASLSKPLISGLVMAKEVKKLSRQAFLPFKFRDMEVTPDPRNEFGSKDKIAVIFNLERGSYTKPMKGVMEVKDIFDPGKYRKEYPFATAADEKIQVITRELEPMSPGYYSIAVRLLAPGGALLAEAKEKFTISIRAHIAETTHVFKITPPGNRFLYYHILGIQYMRLNNLDKAELFLNKAFHLRPDYPKVITDFCHLMLKKKRPAKVLEIVENLKNREKQQFDYYALRGKAFFQEGKYKDAIENLSKANRIYDSDVSVLNFLGFSYLQTGNKEEARKLFTASLRLDDRQKNIAAILKKME